MKKDDRKFIIPQYPNYSFSPTDKTVFRGGFGSPRQIFPINGFFCLKRDGKRARYSLADIEHMTSCYRAALKSNKKTSGYVEIISG
jgi:hypothetical protein